MKRSPLVWLFGLLATLTTLAVPVVYFWPRPAAGAAPAPVVADRPQHTDHSDIIAGPFETGRDVTQACLECHTEAAPEVMQTTHWTWESEPVQLPGREGLVTIGKQNQINNFCIGIQGNWNSCTSCHAGYNWFDASYDFSDALNVDCLACHASTSVYSKAKNGNPAQGVDLVAAAQSVALPTRDQCGKCHFNGGGGNGVKHGDLDQSLIYPSAEQDVHMGGADMLCTDCHVTEDHQIRGSAVSVTVGNDNLVACADCHSAPNLHADARIDDHVDTVACQTCHIPAMALADPTKVSWDWSTAGQDIGDDPHAYLKIKGSFVYANDVPPVYLWDNGTLAERYLLGDVIDPAQPTYINRPAGSRDDPTAKIAPFKLHVARQPYDTVYNTLLQPLTAGEGGYWTTFDWPSALAKGAEFTGQPFSGEYGFATTYMYWRTSHMVQPADQALTCTACHAENGRLDWQALGYPGDPMEWGGRTASK